MADTKRDVELRLAATTTGTDQVKALAKELSTLAKEGSDAAPEIEQLAQEVERLGTTTGALRTFEQLSLELDKTSTNLNEARNKAELLGQAFAEQKAKTDAFRESQAQAKAAVSGTEQSLVEARAALNTFKANADAATRATVGYKDTLRELRNNVAELENTLAQQKGLVAKKSEANEVERALTKLGTAYDNAQKDVTKFEQRLQAQSSATESAKAELNTLGIATDSLSTAQQAVQASIIKTTQAISSEKVAAEYLQAELRDAARAEQEFGAVNAIEKKRQEAIRLQQAADYVNFWTDALNRAEAAEKQLALEAKNAAEALNRAFSTTGIRSAEAIRAEINQIVAALTTLKNDSRVTGAEFDRAFIAAKARVEALERELRGLPATLRETTTLTAGLRQGFSQLTAAFGLFELGRGFIDANTRLETLRRSLTLITGSTELAARQIDFLKTTADRAGLSYNILAQDFVNFTAAANTSGISLEKQREVFGAVANAAGQLGLNTDRVGLILQALSQTASKGKVSLEELQGQLGESLPGALSIVANGFGITKSALLELVKSGIDVESFFDAFVKGTKTAFGDGAQRVDSFAAAWARFKNQLSETATFFGNEGGVLGALVTVIGQTSSAVRGLGGAFELLGKIVGISGAAIANFDLTSPIESTKRWSSAIKDAADEIQVRLDKANGKIKESADATTDAQSKSAQAVIASAQAAAAAIPSFQTATNAELAAAAAASSNASAQGAAAAATARAGKEAGAASSGWAQLALAYKQSLAEAENQVSISEKIVDAKKIEGQARIAIAKITGDEFAALQATAEASRNEAIAIGLLAAARQQEVAILVEQRNRLQELAAAKGDESGARKKEIDDITLLIEKKSADAEKSAQQADATRLETQAKALAVQTYKDNSAALTELRQAYDSTREALFVTQAAQQSGLATQAEVNAAMERAARAEVLYKDAVADTSKNLDLKIRSAQANLSVTEASIAAQRAAVERELAQAQAYGNTALALDRTLKLKELDIKLSDAKVAAIRAEIAALTAQIEAEAAALKSNDPLLEQKRAEIELRRTNIKVKELEIQKIQESRKAQEQEIDTLRQRGLQSSSTANQYVNDRQREASANDNTRQSVERLAEAERKRRNVDANGFSLNTAGQTINAAGNTRLSIFNQLKSYGLTDQEAQSVSGEFVDGKGEVSYFNNPGQLKYGGRDSTMSLAIQKAAEKVLFGRGPGAASGGAGAAGQTYTVNVNLGGQQTTINTASASDAQRLAQLLQQIGQAAARTGP